MSLYIVDIHGEIEGDYEIVRKYEEQEPFMATPCISSKVCEHDRIVTLDKIRAEIEQLTIVEGGDDYVRKMAELFSLKMKVLQIIDKYKAETEGKE